MRWLLWHVGIFHVVLLTHGSGATVATSGTGTWLLSPTKLALSRHLSDLPFVLQVSLPILIKVLLLDNGALIKQTFRESMVLTLNPLRFSLPHAQVQARRLVDSVLRSRCTLTSLSGTRSMWYRRPFAI